MAYTQDTRITGSDSVDRFAHRTGANVISPEQSNSGSSEGNLSGPMYAHDLPENSSLRRLLEALHELTGRYYMTDFRDVDTDGSRLRYAGIYADNISQSFEGVNPSVLAAWEGVSTFSHSIDSMVRNVVTNFVDELKKFIESTQWHEKEMQQAATNANDLADKILKELQTLFNGPNQVQ